MFEFVLDLKLDDLDSHHYDTITEIMRFINLRLYISSCAAAESKI